MRKNVENKVISLPNKTTLKKTISTGVSEIPTDTDKFWQVVKFADVTLYKAKESSRNKVVRYQKDMWQEEEY
ncbi:MAG: diguanylate cyclase [Hydrogenobaculum sp.]